MPFNPWEFWCGESRGGWRASPISVLVALVACGPAELDLLGSPCREGDVLVLQFQVGGCTTIDEATCSVRSAVVEVSLETTTERDCVPSSYEFELECGGESPAGATLVYDNGTVDFDALPTCTPPS